MPDGYVSNIARCANEDKGSMHGMKCHDCHVFMECLLPICFWSLPEFVWSALAELSRFFKDLCSNTLRMNDLVKMKENIPIILCKLERIFPQLSLIQWNTLSFIFLWKQYLVVLFSIVGCIPLKGKHYVNYFNV